MDLGSSNNTLGNSAIQKAIAYDLQERYQTVDDLSEDLRRYMAGLSVSAKQESLWSRIMRSIFG